MVTLRTKTIDFAKAANEVERNNLIHEGSAKKSHKTFPKFVNKAALKKTRKLAPLVLSDGSIVIPQTADSVDVAVPNLSTASSSEKLKIPLKELAKL
jgi:predicted dinucleotide-utilizing enzyme